MSNHFFQKQFLAVCILLIAFISPCHANMTGSSVTSHAPQPIANTTFELIVEVSGQSSDLEFLDKFTLQLPLTWTINQTVAPPTNTEPTCSGTARTGWTTANLVYWQKNAALPSHCGLWHTRSPNNVHQFIVNVTVPDCSGSPWSLNWTIDGDAFGAPPHSISGTLHINSCTTLTTGKRNFNFKVVNYPCSLSTQLSDINNSRKIVGIYSSDMVTSYGFMLADGTFTHINYPGAISTYVLGINDQDHIAGFYRMADSIPRCFHHPPDGPYSTLTPPGATSCIATDINDSDTIVGFYTDASSKTFGFTYDGSTYTTFSYPSSNVTMAYGINNHGEIVGRYIGNETIPQQHGFRLNGSTFTSFHFPGNDHTGCSKITDSGIITGFCIEDVTALPGKSFGLLIKDNAKYTQVIYPGATRTSMGNINNKGDLVGSYSLDGTTFSGIVAFNFPWELYIPALGIGQEK